jgi:UDP-GlcNAc:undecaprenyl-phosphate/decaprenyl-phosphate GlcNAc-1-phosphate transferase
MTPTTAPWLLILQTFALTLPSVYLVRHLGLRLGWLDRPTGRKIHETSVVTLGGLGILIGLFTSFLFFLLWRDGTVESTVPLIRYREHAHLWLLFGASLVVIAIGVWDDLRDSNPFVKLGFQTLAAALFVGFRVTSGKYWQFEVIPPQEFFLNLVVLTGWIVLLMNAINLIDGLDGLAAGITAIAAFWLLLANEPMENRFLTWVSAMLLGSCAAFLVFNFHPAKIFMGDTGALLLGIWLGAGSSEGEFMKLSGLILATPIVLLIVPLIEVVSSALRRFIGGQGVFKADSWHMHHRLLKLGFRHRSIVLFYYCITFLLGMLGYLLAPSGFDAQGAPVPRMADPNMMFGILFVICGTVLMAYRALAAIERRFESVLRSHGTNHGSETLDVTHEGR